MARRPWAFVLGAGILVLGWLAFLPSGEDRPVWSTALVERGKIVAEVTATGRVEPRESVEVGTYVSGPVLEVDVDFNAPVRAGQRLAKLDPRTFEGQVAHARADLSLARAGVERASAALELERSKLRRSESLGRKGVVATEELEIARSNTRQAEAELAVAQAEVERAQARLGEARVNLSYTDIISPIDGMVILRDVEVGQTVAASFQTPVLFVIANDLRRMKVIAYVSEADVGRIEEGQLATFTVDSFPGRPFPARVIQVRQVSTPTEGVPELTSFVVTYDVVLEVDNVDGLLRPGMTAAVRITTAELEDALKVPRNALRFRPPGASGPAFRSGAAEGRVYRLEDGEPRAIDVQVGIVDDQFAAVQSRELVAGDRVITRMASSGDTDVQSLVGRVGRR